MAISFKNVIFECKPGMLGQVDIAKIVGLIGKDLGPGIPVDAGPAAKLLKKAQDGRKKGKFLNAVAKAGIVGKDMVFGITSDSEEDKVVLVKDYEKAKAEAKKGPNVINADRGDDTIDKATDKIKKARGGKEVGDDETLTKGDTAPIVVVAHGGKAESSGKVYAKEFAEKSPKELVDFLVKKKKLEKNYAGTLYLDGCFTAAGKTDKNYAKKVYDLLVKDGFKYITVKGNLGVAATNDDGSESVVDAQEEKRLKEEAKKDIAEAKKKLAAVQDRQSKLQKVWDNLAKRHGDDSDAFYADPGIDLLAPELKKLATEVAANKKQVEAMKKKYKDLKHDLEKTFKYDITDLVGTFGPEKLRKDSRFAGLFR